VSDVDPGTAAEDLHAVVQHLGVNRFHLVGCAAGGGIALDYALSHPGQLLSVVVACAIGGIAEPDYAERAKRLRPSGFDDLPASFRELSPSYRAANPKGVAEWERLERESVSGRRIGQQMANRIDWTSLSRLRMPILVIGGDADLYAPPALLRVCAAHIPGATLVIIPEGGHSLYWEAPHAFNTRVLSFWAQIGRCNGPD
jgi:pimeloyl-ACP methyl ester carboxylesterase